ncbi:hypothetical protein B7R22_16695 [Subtercola boreus]|uniref:Integrase catalytic domain-containing protein n=1 Tax=Subtercola boreus TaxID=120213 RepID=A0A3E0VPZ3_9MICO|nr:hypothetical protein B7R22_16695 [Subtercola boreus]
MVPPRSNRRKNSSRAFALYCTFSKPLGRPTLAQYTSADVERWATRNGATLSCGATGVCWDNAAAESFFATLKNEMYCRTVFPTRAEARTRCRGAHRGVLQPETAALNPRLPHAPRGPPGSQTELHRRDPRGVTTTKPRSKKLDTAQY